MVNNRKAFIAALTATTLLTAGAAWAASPQTPDQQKSTPQQTSADKDFGKLSADGASAFQDVTLTRIAIFDGRIDDAKKYVNMADTALGEAGQLTLRRHHHLGHTVEQVEASHALGRPSIRYSVVALKRAAVG